MRDLYFLQQKEFLNSVLLLLARRRPRKAVMIQDILSMNERSYNLSVKLASQCMVDGAEFDEALSAEKI